MRCGVFISEDAESFGPPRSGLGSTGQHMTCGDLIPQSADSVGTLCTGLGSTGQHMTCGDLILQSADSVGTLWTGVEWGEYELRGGHPTIKRQSRHTLDWNRVGKEGNLRPPHPRDMKESDHHHTDC